MSELSNKTKAILLVLIAVFTASIISTYTWMNSLELYKKLSPINRVISKELMVPISLSKSIHGNNKSIDTLSSYVKESIKGIVKYKFDENLGTWEESILFNSPAGIDFIKIGNIRRAINIKESETSLLIQYNEQKLFSVYIDNGTAVISIINELWLNKLLQSAYEGASKDVYGLESVVVAQFFNETHTANQSTIIKFPIEGTNSNIIYRFNYKYYFNSSYAWIVLLPLVCVVIISIIITNDFTRSYLKPLKALNRKISQRNDSNQSLTTLINQLPLCLDSEIMIKNLLKIFDHNNQIIAMVDLDNGGYYCTDLFKEIFIDKSSYLDVKDFFHSNKAQLKPSESHLNHSTILHHIDHNGEKFLFRIDALNAEAPLSDKGVAIYSFLDITRKKQHQDILIHLEEQFAFHDEENFWNYLVTNLSSTFDCYSVLIGLLSEDKKSVQTLSLCEQGKIVENVTYDISGTPCDSVSKKNLCIIKEGVRESFPSDLYLIEHGIESYCGVSITDESGNAIGILVVLDNKKLIDSQYHKSILGIYSQYIYAELQRRQKNQQLFLSSLAFNGANGLFVLSGELRFLKVNDSFTRITGYCAGDVEGRDLNDIFPELASTKLNNTHGQEVLAKFISSRGDYIDAAINIQSIIDDNSNTRFYVGNFIDKVEV